MKFEDNKSPFVSFLAKAVAVITAPAAGVYKLFLNADTGKLSIMKPDGTVDSAATDGTNGSNGSNGSNGQGVPTGGAANQVLAKNTGTNFDTHWVDPAAGGGGGIADAPSDDQQYARKNAAWVVVTSGGGGGAVLPVIVQQGPVTRSSSDAAVTLTNPPAAGNYLLLIKLGNSGNGPNGPGGGWTTLYSGSPQSAQGAYVGFRPVVTGEAAPSATVGGGDWYFAMIFEISGLYNAVVYPGATNNQNDGSNYISILPSSNFAGSLRIIGVEWDNHAAITSVNNGATMVYFVPDDGSGDTANHKGGIFKTSGSPLLPVRVSLNSGADRPEIIVVDLLGT